MGENQGGEFNVVPRKCVILVVKQQPVVIHFQLQGLPATRFERLAGLNRGGMLARRQEDRSGCALGEAEQGEIGGLGAATCENDFLGARPENRGYAFPSVLQCLTSFSPMGMSAARIGEMVREVFGHLGHHFRVRPSRCVIVQVDRRHVLLSDRVNAD